MDKLVKRLLAAVFMLTLLVSATTPAKISAEWGELHPNKTNKLKLSDTLFGDRMSISESVKAGKTLTFTVEVPKGALDIYLSSTQTFKAEVYDSKNKVVLKMESSSTLNEDGCYDTGDLVNVSKGKYKIKITPSDKKSKVNISGSVAMIKNDSSRTMTVGNEYDTAVKKGKTYKFKFKAKEKGVYTIENRYYGGEELEIEYPAIKILNSEGKTVKEFKAGNYINEIKLSKGTYTIVIKADITGCLNTYLTMEE